MSHIIKLHDDEVEVTCFVDPYIPANMDGHPDTWTPAEGGEIELDEIWYRNMGLAKINGMWVQCEVQVNVTSIVSPEDQMEIMDELERRERSTDDYNE